ncbi:MAG: CPXCG motif-containing cysteine-rich protein [Campylobacterales bacterium]|nr:CPXCG motif-containing cysteine-rich protein [Campylobacterales bacterium]
MEEKFYTCPYCLQYVSTLLDTGIYGSANIVDDCEVCCRPIEINYSVEDYQVVEFDYRAIEGNEY